MKLRTSLQILALTFIFSGLAWLRAQEDDEIKSGEDSAVLLSTAKDLTQIWPDKSCAQVVTRQTGYPLISLACKKGYSKQDRAVFLDAIFKRGYILKNETYKLSPGYGFYLYKTEYPISSGRLVFFKLYFRDAAYLFPKTPQSEGQVAVFVQDTYRMKDLLRWQTLGIPLSYGVVSHKQETAAIAGKIREYGQEAWAALSLEPQQMTPLKGKVLSVEGGLDAERRKQYLDEVFEQIGDVTGISNRMGSLFTKNVFAVRTLLQDVRDRKVENFLDTLTTGKSVAFETAQVMSFNAFKRDIILDHDNSQEKMKARWAEAMKILREQGYVLIVVHAGNWRSFELLKDEIGRKRPALLQFVKVSSLPVNKR